MMFVGCKTTDSRTAGTYVESRAWISEELNITISQDHRSLAYEYGLVSEHRYLAIGTKRFALSIVPQYRSVRLPDGLMPALTQCLRHNTAGMVMELGIATILIALGATLSYGAFIALGSMLLLFLLSVLTHEAGHVAAYRIITGPEAPGYLVRKGSRSHLVRVGLLPRSDRVVIIAGPAAPLGVAIIFLPFAWILPIPYFAWLAIALGHFVMLAIPVGDGRNFRNTYRQSQRDTLL